MWVFDDVLPDPMAYRQAALAGDFGSVSMGENAMGDHVWFHGIQLAEDPTIPDWITAHYPQLTPTLSIFRLSPGGQVEPHFVHTDRDMGEWTAILYLNPDPPAGDGTTFWRHRETGAIGSVAENAEALHAEHDAWRDLDQWDAVAHVEAQFGRLVLFHSTRFHSRSIPENYGEGDEARLIQVVFGLGQLEKDDTPCLLAPVPLSRSQDSPLASADSSAQS